MKPTYIELRLYYLQYWYNTQRTKWARPKFKKGQFVEFDLSYALVIYKIVSIERSSEGYVYKLKGERILSSDGTNPYMTEAKNYEPYCYYFDKTAKLASLKYELEN